MDSDDDDDSQSSRSTFFDEGHAATQELLDKTRVSIEKSKEDTAARRASKVSRDSSSTSGSASGHGRAASASTSPDTAEVPKKKKAKNRAAPKDLPPELLAKFVACRPSELEPLNTLSHSLSKL